MEEFPGRLRYFLSEQGLSQKDLACKSGLTESSISHYVAGTRAPQVKALIALAGALGIGVDELLGI